MKSCCDYFRNILQYISFHKIVLVFYKFRTQTLFFQQFYLIVVNLTHYFVGYCHPWRRWGCSAVEIQLSCSKESQARRRNRSWSGRLIREAARVSDCRPTRLWLRLVPGQDRTGRHYLIRPKDPTCHRHEAQHVVSGVRGSTHALCWFDLKTMTVPQVGREWWRDTEPD